LTEKNIKFKKKKKRKSKKRTIKPRTVIKKYSKNPELGRLTFTTQTSSVFSVVSLLPYKPEKLMKKKEKLNKIIPKDGSGVEGTSIIQEDAKPKETSYSQLLQSNTFIIRDESSTERDDAPSSYNPNFLDDPILKTGKHRIVLSLAGFRESIIPFVNADDLKEELNDQFRQRHPWVNPDITLHIIRKLKRKLLDLALEKGFEPSSIALSYVLLEKLLLKNLPSKDQIELFGAACLLLAVKFNDPLIETNSSVMLQGILDAIEKIF